MSAAIINQPWADVADDVTAAIEKNDRRENEQLRQRVVELEQALDGACGLIESAERETNWISGDPYGDSATVGLRALLSERAKMGEG